MTDTTSSNQYTRSMLRYNSSMPVLVNEELTLLYCKVLLLCKPLAQAFMSHPWWDKIEHWKDRYDA